MRSRSFLLVGLFFATACGGPSKNAANGGAKSGAGKADDSIADEAAKSGGIAGAGLEGAAAGGSAVASSLEFNQLDRATPVKLDGVPQEWPARTNAGQVVSGDAAGLALNSGLQYDDDNIYVAGEVTDAKCKVGVDHTSLVLAISGPGGVLVAREIAFYAGKPGESSGSVKYASGAQKGRDVVGAKIVEAPAKGGYTFEAVVPWSTFTEARLVRVGMRGVVRYVDGSGAVLATGPGDGSSPSTLPALLTESEQAILEGLLQPKGLPTTPKIDIYADVAGTPMKERISLYGSYLTVCGPGYRGGKEYFVRDVAAEVLSLEARNITGHEHADLLLRRRFTLPKGGTRDWFEIWNFNGDEPQTAFAHEIEVTTPGGHKADDALHVGEKEIDVSIDAIQGWDASTYKEPIVGDAEPILLPWGPVKRQTYRLQSGKFVKTAEEKNPASTTTTTITPREALPTDVPTPPVRSSPNASELGKELLVLYKKDHGVAADAKPKTDLEVSVAEDARPERVLLYGRDLVVLGPGFRGGTSYAFLSLSQFSADGDVKELTARDLTGDGAADILVRGVRHVAQPSGPAVDVDLLFVYQITQSAINLIFSIKTARELQGKRVQGLVQFIPAKSGKGFDVMSSAGRATGFTKDNFPWAEQKPGTASIEPVLLPWGTITNARYAFDGKSYAVTP